MKRDRDSGEDADRSPPREPWGIAAPALAVPVLFALALLVRLPGLGVAPLEFHPTRQYRSAVITRALTLAGVDGQEARAARRAARREGRLEPPLMEHATATIWRASGRESLAAGRLLAIGCWLTGGLFLLLLARRLSSWGGSLVALATYLFAPFAIAASRSFQPDALMVALVLASAWLGWRWHEARRLRWLIAAGVVGGLACLVKPMSVFFAALPLAPWLLERDPAGPSRRAGRTALFGGLVLAPAGLYYVAGLLAGGKLGGQLRHSVIPGLLVEPRFWNGWLEQVGVVVGYPLLVAALAGSLLAARRSARLWLAGLWVGYALFGCVFTWHVHTHDYYSLPLVPIAALGLAPLADVSVRGLAARSSHRRARLASVLLLLLGVVLALRAGRPRPPVAEAERLVTRARQIGDLVEHSDRTLLLAPHYGLPLEYHAGLAGRWWPTRADLAAERAAGERSPAAAERLGRMLSDEPADWFIVTDGAAFASQDDLRAELFTRDPDPVRGAGYLVFDLRGAAAPRGPISGGRNAP